VSTAIQLAPVQRTSKQAACTPKNGRLPMNGIRSCLSSVTCDGLTASMLRNSSRGAVSHRACRAQAGLSTDDSESERHSPSHEAARKQDRPTSNRGLDYRRSAARASVAFKAVTFPHGFWSVSPLFLSIAVGYGSARCSKDKYHRRPLLMSRH